MLFVCPMVDRQERILISYSLDLAYSSSESLLLLMSLMIMIKLLLALIVAPLVNLTINFVLIICIISFN